MARMGIDLTKLAPIGSLVCRVMSPQRVGIVRDHPVIHGRRGYLVEWHDGAVSTHPWGECADFDAFIDFNAGVVARHLERRNRVGAKLGVPPRGPLGI